MQARGGDGRTLPNDDNDPFTDDDKPSPRVAGVDADELRSYVERIERIDGERRELGEDIKEIKAEAKRNGILIPVLTLILRERRKDRRVIEELHAVADVYRRALEDADE
jgi:uncharacterized protein (UPF0335 family)